MFFNESSSKFLEIKKALKLELNKIVIKIGEIYFNPFSNKIDIDNISTSYTLPKYIKIATSKSLLYQNMPALLPLKSSFSILIDSETKTQHNNLLQLNAAIIASTIHPKKLNLTLIDAENYGKSFSYLTELSDEIKGQKILDESSEIEKKLVELEKRISYINQKIISHRYDSLDKYNVEKGEFGEAYSIMFIANFPHGFDGHGTADKLLKIIKNGYAAGVLVLMTVDRELCDKIREIDIDDILKHTLVLNSDLKIDSENRDKNLNEFKKYFNNKLELHPVDFSSYKKEIPILVNKINQKLDNMKNRKIDISKLLTDDNFWTGDSSKTISMPIGQSNNGEVFNFSLHTLNKNFSALIAGATGSGKSYLLHNIIINAAHLYSPDELRFYLLDFKDGIEFKKYIDLPHVEVLSLKSEKEFAASMFLRLEEIIEERSTLFKKHNVANLVEYREQTGKKMPKIFLIIDEFQDMLKESRGGRDKITTIVKDGISKLAAKWRAYGVHCILSTQTYKDVNLPENVMPNITTKIAMQMTKSEGLSFIENESVSKFKQGEAICIQRDETYFMTAHLPPQEISKRVKKYKDMANVDFKRYLSDVSQNISIHSNSHLLDLINDDNFTVDNYSCKSYIGKPIALREEHSSFTLRKVQNSNMAVVGQDIESALSIFTLSAFQILKSSNENSVLYIFDLFEKRSKYHGKLDFLNSIFPSTRLKTYGKNEFKENIGRIHEKMLNNSNSRIVVMVLNASSLKLPSKYSRPDDDPLSDMITNGSNLGLHFIGHFQNFKFLFDFMDVDKFDIRIALKGSDSYKFVYTDSYDDMIIDIDNKAVIRSPETEYEAKSLKVYSYDSVADALKGNL